MKPDKFTWYPEYDNKDPHPSESRDLVGMGYKSPLSWLSFLGLKIPNKFKNVKNDPSWFKSSLIQKEKFKDEFWLEYLYPQAMKFARPRMAPVKHKADGGYISGAGTSTSDSIPARLSNGEYVVRASAVSQYGTSFLDKVNERRFALGGLANSQRFNIPSIGANYRVGTNNADNSSFNDNSVYNINVSVDTNASPDDIANAVMKKIERQQQTMVTKRTMGGIR